MILFVSEYCKIFESSFFQCESENEINANNVIGDVNKIDCEYLR